MKSLARYVANHGITVEIISGPNWETDDTGWEHHAYRIKMRNADRGTEMVLDWKHGVGIAEGPDERPEQVFECLVGESWGYRNADSFEDWAGEYGYDPDSRKAEATWEAVGKNANAFLELIGGDAELEKLATKY